MDRKHEKLKLIIDIDQQRFPSLQGFTATTEGKIELCFSLEKIQTAKVGDLLREIVISITASITEKSKNTGDIYISKADSWGLYTSGRFLDNNLPVLGTIQSGIEVSLRNTLDMN